ncbi:MAG: hypothetical protein ABII25_01000 [bacterium]
MKKIFGLLLISILIIVGCSSTVKFIKLDKLPNPKLDKGLIYFYKGVGNNELYGFYIFENKKKIGYLYNESFFFIYADPGIHTYYSQNAADYKKYHATIEVEAGKVYALKATKRRGVLNIAFLELNIINELEAKSKIRNFDYVVFEETSSKKQ